MKTTGRMLLSTGLALLPLETAAAMEVAAIVEQTSGFAGGVGEMDLLEEDRVIELGPGAHLTLGYPQSCLREIITGGRVTIGARQSSVAGGVIKLQKVDCDGGRILRSGKRADVAGAVFRREKTGVGKPKPEHVLYGVSPVIRFPEPVLSLTIERLDRPRKTLKLPIGSDRVDLAARHVELAPSGVYALSAGSRSVIVQVSPMAKTGAPLLSRLIVM